MKTIIINRMYAGEYLSRGIGGGEVINLLHSDDEKNYCFINPSGMFNPKYNDTVTAVIHTRLYEAGCFEVLGVSVIETAGQLIHPKGNNAKERALIAAGQLKDYATKHPINYGGIPYIKDTDVWPSISFVSQKLLYPKNQIFIIDSAYKKEMGNHLTIYNLPDKRFAKQSLLMYVDDEQNPLAFRSIIEMINNNELWEEKIVKINDKAKHNYNHFNFLTLINREDDELAFSNMFSYFFSKDRNLGQLFIKEVLNKEISDDYIIKREFHNIDLWIEDSRNVIVIENKIKSGINGVSKRHDFSENGLVQSQLSKYFAYASNYAKKDGKTVDCFIFVPNYNKLDLSIYSGSKHYKVIRYRDIYNFLMRNNMNDAYYSDFCKAVRKHTKDIPVDYSEILLNYLVKQISKNQSKIIDQKNKN